MAYGIEMSDEGDMPSKNEIKQKARTFLEAVFNNLDLDNNLRVIQSGS